jgi:peroxiredoxin family protein
MSSQDNNATTIVVFSGDMDKIFAAFTIAAASAAAGMETTLFFTFWGLKAIQKGNRTGKGLMAKMLGIINRGGINRLGPSKFNFGGLGRWMFKKMMADKGVTPLEELRQTCLDLGVHFLACKMSMDVMEITREDLIDEVEDVVGAARMMRDAANSKVHFFI